VDSVNGCADARVRRFHARAGFSPRRRGGAEGSFFLYPQMNTDGRRWVLFWVVIEGYGGANGLLVVVDLSRAMRFLATARNDGRRARPGNFDPRGEDRSER
jgi:hypothetical protein